MEKIKGPKIDMTLAVPTMAVTLAVALCLIIAPDRSASVINTLLGFLTNQFGWLFEIAGLGALLFCLWLSFSRYGRIKLGGREEKPVHSTITWFAMLFCTGIGTTLFYWSVAEPLSYLMGPPNGVIPGSSRRICPVLWFFSLGIYCMGALYHTYNCNCLFCLCT